MRQVIYIVIPHRGSRAVTLLGPVLCKCMAILLAHWAELEIHGQRRLSAEGAVIVCACCCHNIYYWDTGKKNVSVQNQEWKGCIVNLLGAICKGWKGSWSCHFTDSLWIARNSWISVVAHYELKILLSNTCICTMWDTSWRRALPLCHWSFWPVINFW